MMMKMMEVCWDVEDDGGGWIKLCIVFGFFFRLGLTMLGFCGEEAA
jgi:hypothetical protein